MLFNNLCFLTAHRTSCCKRLVFNLAALPVVSNDWWLVIRYFAAYCICVSNLREKKKNKKNNNNKSSTQGHGFFEDSVRDLLQFHHLRWHIPGTFPPNVTLGSKSNEQWSFVAVIIVYKYYRHALQPLSDGSFRSPCRGFVIPVWVVLCFQFHFYTVILTRGQKVKSVAARCKGTAGQGTWQVSVLIPFPSGRHASSVWQSVRKQVPMATPAGYRDLTGKDRERERVQRHFLSLQQGFLFLRHISSPGKKKKKNLSEANSLL